jgi:hypothetical protein
LNYTHCDPLSQVVGRAFLDEMRNNPNSGFMPDSALLRTVAVHQPLLEEDEDEEMDEQAEEKVRTTYVALCAI